MASDSAADNSDFAGTADMLSPSESLDSDQVRNDDGDQVVDPPEHWLEVRDDESLDDKLAAEEPETSADTPISDAAYLPEGISPAEHAVKHAEVVDGVIVQDSRIDRGQIDGTPEDGDSFFPVVR